MQNICLTVLFFIYEARIGLAMHGPEHEQEDCNILASKRHRTRQKDWHDY